MARQIIDLSEKAFVFINGPLLFLNLTANIFYAFCLIFPLRNTQRLKHPLRLILGFLVWYSIFYWVSLASLYSFRWMKKSFGMTITSWLIVPYCVHNSMTSYARLTFYYYIQIVPVKRALLIWMKKNIKVVIYVALFLDGIIFLFGDALAFASILLQNGLTYINGTMSEHEIYHLFSKNHFGFVITNVYIFICLCIMTVCNLSTVQYLHRHMRSVAQSGSSFSTLRSQMRIAITGIFQGMLYFLYDTFYFIDSFTFLNSIDFRLGIWIFLTAISLYISGTTVSLGISQAAFRRRAADVWKTFKTFCGVVMVTHDVTLHSVDIN